MRKWANTLNAWLEAAGWTVAEYARRVNADKSLPEVSVASIRKYLDGLVNNPRGDILDRLAMPFGKTRIELEYNVQIENTAKVSKIPLLTMNEIGTLKTDSGISRDWGGRSVSAYSNDVSEGWFGVIVADDACAPAVRRGDTVWCDPEADLEPGALVVASVKGLSVGVCRRYRKTDALAPDAFRLVALNADYPDIENSADKPVTIHGRVVRILSVVTTV